MRSKVLQIVKGFYPDKGGIETYSYEIVKELSKYYDIFVLVTHSRFSGKEKIGKVKIIRIKKLFDFLHAPINLPYFRLINRIKPDVIHLHIPNPLHEIYLLFYILLFGKKFKLIVTYHADIPHYTIFHRIIEFFRRFYLVTLLKFFDVLIATSKEYAYSSKILKLFYKNVEVVHLGIESQPITISPKKLKKKYRIKDEKILLFVGRLFPYKGLEYLIEAVYFVSKKFENFKLFVVGSGEKERELKNLSRKLGVSDKIVFAGAVDEKTRDSFYKLCDIFILPSVNRGEAFGISLLEAMRFGKPLVTTKIPGSGVSFVNKHLVTGLVVEPRNSKALSEAILKLLKNDRLRLKLGKNSKKRFLNYFTKEKMIRSTIQIYKSLLS